MAGSEELLDAEHTSDLCARLIPYCGEIQNLVEKLITVIPILKDAGLADFLEKLFDSIISSVLSLEDITLLCFVDKLRFLNCTNPFQFRHNEVTKRFWLMTLNMLGNRALRILGGFGLRGLDKDSRNNPECSRYNFKIPTIDVLKKVEVGGTRTGPRKPGIFPDMVHYHINYAILP